MAAKVIGRVKSGKSRKSYEVKWNHGTQEVYVSYAGWSKAGKAGTSGHAMHVAEVWLVNK